jgi:hypothetical protein
MPLSDEEQEILHQIEQQLTEEDPKFARGVASITLETHAVRNIRLGFGLFLAGFFTLLTYFLTQALVVGVLAFLMMLAGATLIANNVRKMSTDPKGLKERSRLGKFFSQFDNKPRDSKRNNGR